MTPTTDSGPGYSDTGNRLWQYVQSMTPETADRLSQPASEDVLRVMEHHVGSLLGHLPAEDFEVMIHTSREHLGQLLAAAMLNGYFLRAAEQRMTFDQALQSTGLAADTPET